SVAWALWQQDGVRGGQEVVDDVGHLEVCGGDGEPAVVGDADLETGAPVVAEKAGARGAVGAGQHLDALAWEADAGAVEALDHGFFGGPAAGEAVGGAGAVGLLGGRGDL